MSQNCHLSISNLSRDALLFVTYILGQIEIYLEIQTVLARNLYEIPEKQNCNF